MQQRNPVDFLTNLELQNVKYSEENTNNDPVCPHGEILPGQRCSKNRGTPTAQRMDATAYRHYLWQAYLTVTSLTLTALLGTSRIAARLFSQAERVNWTNNCDDN